MENELKVILTGNDLTLQEIQKVARKNIKVKLHPESIMKINNFIKLR